MKSEYLDALLKSKKYNQERQHILKKRVFITFDNLLKHAGSPGLRPGSKLLDLGSADGALVRVAAEHGLESHGLDITDGVNFETDRFPCDDRTFDAVTAVSLIEHLRSPQMMFQETLRVLKPGGSMILVTPNWNFSFREFFDDPTHGKKTSGEGWHVDSRVADPQTGALYRPSMSYYAVVALQPFRRNNSATRYVPKYSSALPEAA